MKPQDIVALMLTFLVILIFSGFLYKTISTPGHTPPHLADIWKGFVMLILGGLIAYIGKEK